MPQLVAFNRKWAIGSDDFVYPGLAEIILRIIWVIVIASIFHLHKEAFDCAGGHLLHAYYVGLLTLLAISIVMTALVVFTSTRGSMTNIWPRRGLAKLIYVKVAISLPELAWNIIGTYWAFGMSSGCESHIVLTVKGAVISGWVIGLIVLIGIAIVFDPLGALHHSHSINSGEDQAIAQAALSAKRVWEARCKIMCCCVGCDEQSTNAFSGIAEIFSNFFQGIDLVPTDVACGLILVHRQQQREKYLLKSVMVNSETSHVDGHSCAVERSTDSAAANGANSSCTSTLSPGISAPKSWMTVDLMCHYMKFAMASYGWPLYIFTHLMTGTCQLWSQCKCCACTSNWGDIKDDNCCLCNTASIRKTTGVHHDDVVYASFHNKIYETPFFVSIDRQHQAVVIAVRGTLSLKDVITDLTAECDTLEIEGLEHCVAHRGMLHTAKYVQSTLDKLQILEQAFERAQGAKLVITGHSLGAGTAALLAIMLRPRYPDLKCFAFSPPGGLMSQCASDYCKEFVCSVVVGRDIIPRLGIHTMDALKTQLLNAIHNTDVPKYKLLASGVWQMFCGLNEPTLDEIEDAKMRTPLVGNSQGAQSYSTQQRIIQTDRPILAALQEAERHRDQCRITHIQMYPPGQILHIKEAKEKTQCFGVPEYESEWTNAEDFARVIVSPKMLSDHFPDAVMRALDQLYEREHVPMLSSAGNIINV